MRKQSVRNWRIGATGWRARWVMVSSRTPELDAEPGAFLASAKWEFRFAPTFPSSGACKTGAPSLTTGFGADGLPAGSPSGVMSTVVSPGATTPAAGGAAVGAVGAVGAV